MRKAGTGSGRPASARRLCSYQRLLLSAVSKLRREALNVGEQPITNDAAIVDRRSIWAEGWAGPCLIARPISPDRGRSLRRPDA